MSTYSLKLCLNDGRTVIAMVLI